MGLSRLFGPLMLVAHLARHSFRRRPTLTLHDRLSMLPRTGLPITAPVTIHWDDHQIPFIKAATDDDLAVGLGLVHAHLRLGQLEMMRRLATGRVAEMVGTVGIKIDRLMRTLDLGRPVPEIMRGMPEETRRWLDRFVCGLNHYIANVRTLPPELHLFGLGRDPWTSLDVLTLGRLVSIDVNWLLWLRLLKFRDDPDWKSVWRRLVEHDLMSPNATDPASGASLSDLLGMVARTGSNSFAVSPVKSASGAPLLASDPHLSLFLPNPWLIAGMNSPSHHAVGLMIPGLPFVALGRNPWIAWGGTSLHAASSDLVIVPDDETNRIQERTERLAVRWGHERTIRIRDSRWGPIVSDISRFRSGTDTLALRWIGHQPSDEMTAMLGVNRAHDWTGFRAALEGFAVPGQRMVYADSAGRIGRLMAVHLPRRPLGAADIVTAAADGWETRITSAQLPFEVDPTEGYVASANERADAGDLLVSHQFSPRDRKRRLDQLLSAPGRRSVDDVAKIQRDVRWMTALTQRDTLLTWLASDGLPRNPQQERLIAALRDWDGTYHVESHGALVFELVFYHLTQCLVPRRRRQVYAASWGARGLMWQDVHSADPDARRHALEVALRVSVKATRRQTGWGEMHRLRLGHPLMALPISGRRFRVADLPAAGTADTLLKTSHPPSDRRHACQYGSCARHVSDLSRPDHNLFVLLGGQDGWWGSSTFADQIALWERGEYVSVPLASEAAAIAFQHRTELLPLSAAGRQPP